MDLSNIFSLLSRSQRNTLIAFAIHLPLTYTILFDLSSTFREVDLINRSLFASAVAIVTLTASLFATLPFYRTSIGRLGEIPTELIILPIVCTLGYILVEKSLGLQLTTKSILCLFMLFITLMFILGVILAWISLHMKIKQQHDVEEEESCCDK